MSDNTEHTWTDDNEATLRAAAEEALRLAKEQDLLDDFLREVAEIATLFFSYKMLGEALGMSVDDIRDLIVTQVADLAGVSYSQAATIASVGLYIHINREDLGL